MTALRQKHLDNPAAQRIQQPETAAYILTNSASRSLDAVAINKQ